MTKKTLLLTLISSFLFAACLHQPTSEEPATAGVRSLPPVESLNEDGEIDENMFEENQSVSDDDSLDMIEKELEETIILEEDFSDL